MRKLIALAACGVAAGAPSWRCRRARGRSAGVGATGREAGPRDARTERRMGGFLDGTTGGAAAADENVYVVQNAASS